MSRQWNWAPTPSPASECAPPAPEPKGGTHSLAGEGVGESQFRRLEEKLIILPTLCFEVRLISSEIRLCLNGTCGS